MSVICWSEKGICASQGSKSKYYQQENVFKKTLEMHTTADEHPLIFVQGDREIRGCKYSCMRSTYPCQIIP